MVKLRVSSSFPLVFFSPTKRVRDEIETRFLNSKQIFVVSENRGINQEIIKLRGIMMYLTFCKKKNLGVSILLNQGVVTK